jgi:nitroreductase
MSTPEFQVLAGLMRARRSCRDFLQEPIPHDIVGQLFETAQLSASWCNTQPWQVVLASGQAARAFAAAYRVELQQSDACSDLPFPEYDGIYQERRRDCGLQLYASLGIDRGDRAASRRQAEKNYEFFGAPHIAIITTDGSLGTYGAVDCGGYVANLLCIAQSLGLGAIAQGALASHSQFVRRYFQIDDTRRVVCGFAFGYRNPASAVNQFSTDRATLAQVVRHWDARWDSFGSEETKETL